MDASLSRTALRTEVAAILVRHKDMLSRDHVSVFTGGDHENMVNEAYRACTGRGGGKPVFIRSIGNHVTRADLEKVTKEKELVRMLYQTTNAQNADDMEKALHRHVFESHPVLGQHLQRAPCSPTFCNIRLAVRRRCQNWGRRRRSM